MRKLIPAILLVLALVLCAVPAMAQGDAIVKISDGAVNDFDGNELQETLYFTLDEADEYGDIPGFTIRLGDDEYTVTDSCCLAGEIYAVNLGRGLYYNPDMCWGTLFMVPEYGPSDDPYTYCYLYTNEHLFDVGAIPSLPTGMTADADGRITCQIRANHIGTWSRYAEYKLAHGYSWGGEDGFEEFFRICEVPQDVYAMGMIVNLQKDLPLKLSRYDAKPGVELAGNDQQVILAATDDVRWLYVTNMDGSIGGWVEFDGSDYPVLLNVNGTKTEIDDVFRNIFYAD